jgi:hypothetical protein
MNDLMIDSDNVLLLRPVDRGIVPILRSVDVVTEKRLKGIVVAEVFAIKPEMVDAFLKEAEPLFENYGSTGVHEAAKLRTLDATTNNFPQLPVRTDGPFVVWIGVIKDDAAFEQQFAPATKKASEALKSAGLLRGDPELIVMDPAARYRLRWLPEWQ